MCLFFHKYCKISFQPDWDYDERYLPVSQYPSLPGVEIFIDSSGYVSDSPNISFYFVISLYTYNQTTSLKRQILTDLSDLTQNECNL